MKIAKNDLFWTTTKSGYLPIIFFWDKIQENKAPSSNVMAPIIWAFVDMYRTGLIFFSFVPRFTPRHALYNLNLTSDNLNSCHFH